MKGTVETVPVLGQHLEFVVAPCPSALQPQKKVRLPFRGRDSFHSNPILISLWLLPEVHAPSAPFPKSEYQPPDLPVFHEASHGNVHIVLHRFQHNELAGRTEGEAGRFFGSPTVCIVLWAALTPIEAEYYVAKTNFGVNSPLIRPILKEEVENCLSPSAFRELLAAVHHDVL